MDILESKLHLLASAPASMDMTFAEFKSIDGNWKISDINLTRVRGSVRLSSLRIILPREVCIAKKRIARYSFK